MLEKSNQSLEMLSSFFSWICPRRNRDVEVLPPHLDYDLIPTITPDMIVAMREDTIREDAFMHVSAYSTYEPCKCTSCRYYVDPNGEYEALEFVMPLRQMRYETASYSYKQYISAKNEFLNEKNEATSDKLKMAQRRYFLESVNYCMVLNQLRNEFDLPSVEFPSLEDCLVDDPILKEGIELTKKTPRYYNTRRAVGAGEVALPRTSTYMDNGVLLLPRKAIVDNPYF